ncbi:hypothetical protein [Streptomyces meridianus]|uniref:Secreted protein n=1 Tax=Streptomyces meridianus TaxID=2938945 RepID=A0ABT0X0M7_9ACTN|nr:hypothetical protein [Streptomyces meridianus]MCM2576118.1 hypothetical protein [Streptomyces meridianus]
MRKLQKAAVVVAMLGGMGALGVGTAQAAPTQDPVTVVVTQECSATGGEGGASGDAAVGDYTIGEASSTGGEGGAATTVCTVTISG